MLRQAPVQTEDMRLALGEALRRRRKELALNMQTVADRSGLSVGFISQVERGLTSPSLGSLASISAALGLDLTKLLDLPPASDQTRRDVRQPYQVPGADMTYERISTVFEGSQLHSVIVHEPPGHRVEPISHPGEEMFYILSGAITVELEGKVDILRTGDSIHFDSSRVHSTWNHTTDWAAMLWCGTMDVFGTAPPPIHKPDEGRTAPETKTGEEQE
ncbi:MAG: cupin domain-containing protein [Pseudomonadota bacterium]